MSSTDTWRTFFHSIELPVGAPRGYVVGGEYARWLPVRAVNATGRELTGVRVNEDAFTIQFRDLTNMDKASLRRLEHRTGTSIMPAHTSTLTPAVGTLGFPVLMDGGSITPPNLAI